MSFTATATATNVTAVLDQQMDNSLGISLASVTSQEQDMLVAAVVAMANEPEVRADLEDAAGAPMAPVRHHHVRCLLDRRCVR